jgi:hypothetical protein
MKKAGNVGDRDGMRKLLKQALPPVEGADDGPSRDLWPALLSRRDAPTASHWPKVHLLDWAMLAGLAGLVLFVPVSIPVLLYYL